MALRVLFADQFDPARLALLRSSGHDCRFEPQLGSESLAEQIGDAEVLVVRSTRVSERVFAQAPALELVVRAGAGTDTIDVDSASQRGVYVCNVPGRNAFAVAELTMGLLLAVDRRIADATAVLRGGGWNKAEFSAADGLYGRRMAILGLGAIGCAVAERARSFGLDVVGLRRSGRSHSAVAAIRGAGIRLVDTMEELLGDTDIVSLHVPGGPGNEGLVDKDFLDTLPDGAIVLNTSRGNIVDESALIDAMNERGFRAGLDVYLDEPTKGRASWSSPLAMHPSVTGTHHIGAATRQAQEAVADGVTEVIAAYVRGEIVGCVNLADHPLGACSVAIRHEDRVGVLAAILNLLREGGLNVQQMQNQIFSGGTGAAAIATIRLSRTPAPELLTALRALEEVLSVRLQDESSG